MGEISRRIFHLKYPYHKDKWNNRSFYWVLRCGSEAQNVLKLSGCQENFLDKYLLGPSRLTWLLRLMMRLWWILLRRLLWLCRGWEKQGRTVLGTMGRWDSLSEVEHLSSLTYRSHVNMLIQPPLITWTYRHGPVLGVLVTSFINGIWLKFWLIFLVNVRRCQNASIHWIIQRDAECILLQNVWASDWSQHLARSLLDIDCPQYVLLSRWHW